MPIDEVYPTKCGEAFKPIDITPDTPDFRIGGPVVGVVRNMR